MIAFIACSNGLGHIKRIIYICNYLFYAYELKSTIYAPKLKFDHISKILLNQNEIHYLPELVDFDTETSISNWENYTHKNWLSKIQNINEFKLVVSDNLLEILKLRPDAIITASFFWNQIVNNDKLNRETEELLIKYKPVVIGNKYLTLKTSIQNFYGIGFCISIKYNNSIAIKKNLLISGGKDGSDDDFICEVLDYLVLNKPKNIENIFLEPRIFKKTLPKYFKKADFTNKMYESVLISVIRPGLGTITDCLNHGIYILSSTNFKNIELSQNALNLKKLGIGDIFNNMFQLEKLIVDFQVEKTSFIRKLSQIDFSGTEQLGDLINKFYNEK